MNKVVKIFLLLIAVFQVTTIAGAQSYEATQNDFQTVYQAALELNQDRFQDLNFILVGDTVLFPAKQGAGVEAWIASEPVSGRHDCIWILTERYLAGSLVTIPADTIRVKIPTAIAIATPDEAKANFPWWLLLTLVILICIVLLIFNPKLRKKLMVWDRKDQNPDSYPAVGNDLDKATDEELIHAFTRMLKPGERIISVERGSLKRFSGPKRIYVEMEFGDGFNRKVYLLPNERVSKAVVQKDNLLFRIYARSICANGIIADQFQLPEGWLFEVEGKEVVVSTSDVTEESTTEISEVEKREKTDALPIVKKAEGKAKEISAKKLKSIAKIIGKVVSETENGNISLKMNELEINVTYSGKKEKEQTKKTKMRTVSDIIN